jgi:hypothetical protein
MPVVLREVLQLAGLPFVGELFDSWLQLVDFLLVPPAEAVVAVRIGLAFSALELVEELAGLP